ncbi:hypothetical protein EJB05_01940, partial [Eragrostis curvula]
MVDFRNELKAQSRIKHRNVIKLLGYSLEGNITKLVYEFAADGNLHDKLHGDNKIVISFDTSTDSCILHGDVKSANILLDDYMMARVSDFGLSRLLSIGGNTMRTMTVRCSLGYGDPMFIKEGILTQKRDVYGFGVVLVELSTRRKPRDEQDNYLAQFFFSCFAKEKRAVNIMNDEEIAKKEDRVFVQDIAKLAFECLSTRIEDRPVMKKVTQQLVERRRQSQQSYKINPLHKITS